MEPIKSPPLPRPPGNSELPASDSATSLYTPLKEAFAEIERRRADGALMGRVREAFSSQPTFPELAAGPRSVIVPPIASPNLELSYYLDIESNLPLPTLICESSKDKFVHLNYQKRCLGHLTFFRTLPDGSKEVSSSVRVTDFDRFQGQPMDAMTTFWGEPFAEFHHRLLTSYYRDKKLDIVDFSTWFKTSYAYDPEHPYLRFLGLFLTDAVLFANFTLEKYEAAFTAEVVIPAFRKLESLFGIRPLIVPIDPIETDTDLLWCYYPEEIRSLIGNGI